MLSKFSFAEYGTVLEIKDRIMMGNGCSFLSTIGTQRFKVIVSKEYDGYDIAKVQYIQDEKVPQKKLSGQCVYVARRGLEFLVKTRRR